MRNIVKICRLKAPFAASFFMVFASQVAYASIPVPTIDMPAGAARGVQFGVTGHITARCSLEVSSPSINLGDILDPANGAAAARMASVPVNYQCNAPFDAYVTSLNGGLRFQGAGVANFADLVTYSMAIDLQAAGAVTLNCTATQMKGDLQRGNSGCHAASAPGTGVGGGRTSLVISTQSGARPLLQGTYSDIIAIRLAPRLSS